MKVEYDIDVPLSKGLENLDFEVFLLVLYVYLDSFHIRDINLRNNLRNDHKSTNTNGSKGKWNG